MYNSQLRLNNVDKLNIDIYITSTISAQRQHVAKFHLALKKSNNIITQNLGYKLIHIGNFLFYSFDVLFELTPDVVVVVVIIIIIINV